MSQQERTAVVIFRVIGCCALAYQLAGAVYCVTLDLICRRAGMLFDVLPFSIYGAAGVALLLLSRPLARLAAMGLNYD
jgi:hypothetical protein